MKASQQPPTSTLPSAYVFRRVLPSRPVEWFSPCIDTMDRWEVDPPGWEPQWYRHMGHGCRDIRVCPGCWSWQVEYDADGLNANLDDLNAELPVDCAAELANQHRAECPAFNMLAGLAGVPVG